MNNEDRAGKASTAKISMFDEARFPKIAETVRGLNDTERRVIVVLVERDPLETWDQTAKRIGITTRQLFNIRQNEKVQEACYVITKELFKSDIPDVLKTLTKKAKAGEPWAVKLFLEIAGEFEDTETPFSNIHVFSNVRNLDIAKGAEETLEGLRKMNVEELQKELEARLKSSQRNTLHDPSRMKASRNQVQQWVTTHGNNSN